MKLVNIKIGKNFKDGYIFDLDFDMLSINKVYLAYTRYIFHINKKHNIEFFVIKDIISNPDYVIKEKGSNKHVYHFRKTINEDLYTAIVYKGYGGIIPKNKGYLLSVYILNRDTKLTEDVEIYDLKG